MAIETGGKSLVAGAFNRKDLVEGWMNGHLVWSKGLTDIKQMNPNKLFLWLSAPSSQKSYRYDYITEAMDSMMDSASYSVTTNMIPSQLGVTKAFSTGTSVQPGSTASNITNQNMVPESGGYLRQISLRSSVWSISFVFFTDLVLSTDVTNYYILTSLGSTTYGRMTIGAPAPRTSEILARLILEFYTSDITTNNLSLYIATAEETPYLLNDKNHGLNIITFVKDKSKVKIFFNGKKVEGTIPGTSTAIIDTVSGGAFNYNILYNQDSYKKYYADLAFYNRALTDLECYEIFKLYNRLNLPYPKFDKTTPALNNVLFKFMIINESGEDLPLSFWSSMKVFNTSFGSFSVTEVDENGNFWGYAAGSNRKNTLASTLCSFVIPSNDTIEKFSFQTFFNDVAETSQNNVAPGTRYAMGMLNSTTLRKDENLAVMKITSITKKTATLPTAINIVFSASTMQIESNDWAQLATLSMFMKINGDATGTQVFFRIPLSTLMNNGHRSIGLSNITSIEEIEFVLETPEGTTREYVFCVTSMPMPSAHPDNILVKGYYINYRTGVGGTIVKPCFDWYDRKGQVYPCVFMLGYRDSALGAEIEATQMTNECLEDLGM